MRAILERERPWIELTHPEDYALCQGWPRNVKPLGLSLPTGKYVDVDPRAAARAARGVEPPDRLAGLCARGRVRADRDAGRDHVLPGAPVVIAYAIRRLAYGFSVVLGVLLFLFALFFIYAQPDDIARRAVGEKASPEVLAQWIHEPRLRPPPSGTGAPTTAAATTTGACSRSTSAAATPTTCRSRARLREGVGPSLSFTVPLFVIGLLLAIALSLFVAFFRETYIDRTSCSSRCSR